MAKMKDQTLLQKLDEVVPRYLSNYIVWYYSDPEKRIPWDDLCKFDVNFKTKKGENKTEEFAEQNWLPREDVQRAMIIYLQSMKTYNSMKIYQAMLKKALSGDVNSAKYIEDFHKKLDKMNVDESEQNEIKELLAGVTINAED